MTDIHVVREKKFFKVSHKDSESWNNGDKITLRFLGIRGYKV